MFKSARYQPLLALLLVGLALSASMLVIVTNSPEPTPTPYEPPTPSPWPTLTPIPTPFFVDNCEAIGGSYQMQIIDRQSTWTETLPSPDGLSQVIVENNDLYIEHAGSRTLLQEEASVSDLSLYMHWSPDSVYLAYMIRWPDGPLHVVDADGSNLRSFVDLYHPSAFLGWSPDSRYLMVQEDYLSTISLWTPDGERVFNSQDRRRLYVAPYTLSWSPDAQWLIYNWRDDSERPEGTNAAYGFALVAADGSAFKEIELTGQNIPHEPFRHIYHWSPDSEVFSVNYLQHSDNGYIETVKVYNTAGELLGQTTHEIIYPVYSDLQLWTTDWSAIEWAADGSKLAYIVPVETGRFDMLTFDLEARAWTAAYLDMPKPVFYAPSGGYAAAYFGREKPYTVEVMNIGTGAVTKLVENATDAGDPDWSPDGEWVAATWASGVGGARQVTLTWMHPDGTGRHDISGDDRHISDLRWLAGGELAYIAWGADEARIEIADLDTGERRTLAGGLMSVRDLTYDPETDQLAFRWTTGQGVVNREVYNVNGERVHSYRYPGDIEVPVKEFPAPRGNAIALKVGELPYRGFTGEGVILAFTDGRDPIIVRSGLVGLGDPLWSPDGRALAFSQWRGRGETASLQVVNTAGINLWEYPDYGIGWPVGWVRCE